ncbi:MAG: glycosyltransferase [archaeon]
MRVGMLTTSYPASDGDFSGNFVKSLVDHVGKSVLVRIVAPAPAKRYNNDMAEWFHYFPGQERLGSDANFPEALKTLKGKVQLPFFLLVFSLKAIGLARRVDILHANWIVAGVAALIASKITKKPYVLTLRGSDFNNLPKSGAVLKIAHKIIKSASSVITVNGELLERLSRMGVKARLIPNGADTELFRPMDKKECRKELGLPKGKLVLYAGNLVRGKGIGHLIKAIKNMKVSCVLVGKGNDEPRLKKMANDRVIFRGLISHSEMPLYMNAADCLVLPSLSEGRPNVILEAMACGTPVVATRVGGIPEIIKDGVTGFLIEPGDPGAIRNAIQMAIESPSVGKMGRQWIIPSGLSWNNCAQKYIETYKEVLGCAGSADL